ncbi:hypothetical protein [Arenimonas composti]|uniref:hypothetical protein n=1 Tax=Arenimonas composti TaxID=370776 RepID=UPI0012B549DB|nr:hypothetical protein [Arenimonas composti]
MSALTGELRPKRAKWPFEATIKAIGTREMALKTGVLVKILLAPGRNSTAC